MKASKYILCMLVSALKREKKAIVLKNPTCSEVEILMARVQVAQHYKSVAIL